MALKATELRLGNYVRSWQDNNKGNPAKVTVSMLETLSKIGPHQEYIAIKPIEITPEILEKCGFKKTEYSGFFNGVVLLDNHRHLTLWDGRMDEDDTNIFHPPIKFLHQLQNLYFAITGEELPVQL